MVRCLDLYSGTHSFTNVAKQLGYECVSLDIKKKHSPSIVCDILEFDYKIWPAGYFDIVWASPPCTLYSVAAAHMYNEEERKERADKGNAVSRRTLEIIEYLRPRFFCVENPLSSGIWKQGIFDHIPKKRVSYCHYGFPYRKHTLLATNILDFQAKCCKQDCNFITIVTDAQGRVHKHHEQIAQHGPSGPLRHLGLQKKSYTQETLYRVPPDLIKDILLTAFPEPPQSSHHSHHRASQLPAAIIA
jgi:hypothetical protein